METFTELFGSLLLFVYHCFDRVVIHGYPISVQPKMSILAVAEESRFTLLNHLEARRRTLWNCYARSFARLSLGAYGLHAADR